MVSKCRFSSIIIDESFSKIGLVNPEKIIILSGYSNGITIVSTPIEPTPIHRTATASLVTKNHFLGTTRPILLKLVQESLLLFCQFLVFRQILNVSMVRVTLLLGQTALLSSPIRTIIMHCVRYCIDVHIDELI